MTSEALGKTLLDYLLRDIRRGVPGPLLSLAEEDRYFSEILGEKDLREDLQIINSLLFSRSRTRLGGEDSEKLRSAEEHLRNSEEYKELRKRIPRLLRLEEEIRGTPKRERKERLSEVTIRWAEKMALALEEPFPGETYRDLSTAPPILGGFSDGRIWLEVESWVPLNRISEALKQLQECLDAKPRERIRERSLDLFLWVRKRREEFPSETWQETLNGWNDHQKDRLSNEKQGEEKEKEEDSPNEDIATDQTGNGSPSVGGGGKKVTNFHRDYHRLEKVIGELRRGAEELSVRAADIELREADPYGPLAGLKVTRG